MQDSISGLSPHTIRQVGNLVLPRNVAKHRENIAFAGRLHPFGVVFRTHRCDDAVTSLCKGSSSAQAKAAASTRDKDRFCQSSLKQKGCRQKPLRFRRDRPRSCSHLAREATGAKNGGRRLRGLNEIVHAMRER
jgi:hypothetical protein